MTKIHGLHHVTAVTAQAKENRVFYTEVLGLRLVKKTVNQDDVSAYHLFYADEKGTPGTDMTFFDWEMVGPKLEGGTDQIRRTYFRVNGKEAIEYWHKRLTEKNVKHSGVIDIDGREAIVFEDPEGQTLGVVNDTGAPFEGKVWDKIIPKAYALRGFYAVELLVPELELIEPILIDVLHWQKTGSYVDDLTKDTIWKFVMDGGGPGKEVHVRELFSESVYVSTAGSVHHVAFRIKDEQEMMEWIDHLEEMGIPNSGIVERFYFKSLYFRISRGILFELATDGPGFAADEDMEHLGEKLALPPFLEHSRKEIEAILKPL
jgi:glyoxalase family protein